MDKYWILYGVLAIMTIILYVVANRNGGNGAV